MTTPRLTTRNGHNVRRVENNRPHPNSARLASGRDAVKTARLGLLMVGWQSFRQRRLTTGSMQPTEDRGPNTTLANNVSSHHGVPPACKNPGLGGKLTATYVQYQLNCDRKDKAEVNGAAESNFWRTRPALTPARTRTFRNIPFRATETWALGMLKLPQCGGPR